MLSKYNEIIEKNPKWMPNLAEAIEIVKLVLKSLFDKDKRIEDLERRITILENKQD